VSNGNVTGIVGRLVADGQVMRDVVATDRRTTVVKLTPHGARDFARMATAHEAWVGDILSDVSASEVTTLMALLARAGMTLQQDPPTTDD